MVTVKPKEWKKGSTPTMRSLVADPEDLRDGFDVGDHVVVREHDALGDAGAAAREDDGGERIGRAAGRGESNAAGSKRAASQARNLRELAGALEDVFDEDHAGQRSSFALARKTLEVMTVRISHCSMADAMASGPAVKFRLTGTRPASVSADVGQRAADGGGQQHADHLVGSAGVRVQLAISRLPVSTSP